MPASCTRRPRRCAALLGAAVVVAMASGPTNTAHAATATGQPGPVHLMINGVSRWMTSDELVNGNESGPASDVGQYQALVVDADGTAEPTRRPISGTSIKRLLGLAGIDANTLTKDVLIQRTTAPPSAGQFVSISPREVLDGFTGDPGAGCPNQHCQAVFSANYSEQAASFFRPLRGPGDVNVFDDVQSGYGGVLEVSVTTGGKALAITATVSNATPAVRETVTLRATAPFGTNLKWDFGDGSTALGGTHTHTYPAGSYVAEVSGTGIDGGTGSATVAIQVGPKTGNGLATTPTANTAGKTAGSGKGGNGSGGGAAGSGGGSGGKNASSNGPSKTRAPKSGDQKSGASSNAARIGSGPKATTPAAAQVTPAPTTPAAATTPVAATTPIASTPPATTPGAAPGPTNPGPVSGGVDASGAQLVPIRGLAVQGNGRTLAAAVVAAEALAAATPVQREAARAAAGHGRQIAGGVTGAVVIIALLGLGAAREWRRVPRHLDLPS